MRHEPISLIHCISRRNFYMNNLYNSFMQLPPEFQRLPPEITSRLKVTIEKGEIFVNNLSLKLFNPQTLVNEVQIYFDDTLERFRELINWQEINKKTDRYCEMIAAEIHFKYWDKFLVSLVQNGKYYLG